jgi:isopentenyldiphosphate isomerase
LATSTSRIAVVDADNRFVRWEARRTIHELRLVHRSVHIVVFDSQGRLLVQRRHRDKQTYPLYWDTSCAGHVEESDYVAGPDDELDRVYEAVATRELHEELGIGGRDRSGPEVALRRLARLPPEPGVHYEQVQLFACTSDGPFTLQADEVDEIRLVHRGEVPEPMTHMLRWLIGWLPSWPC